MKRRIIIMKRKWYFLGVFIFIICGFFSSSVLAFGFPNSQFIVETEWLEKHIEDPNLVIIHIAPSKDNYDKGHIPGSVFLNYKSIVKKVGTAMGQVPPVEEITKTLQEVGINENSMVVISYEMTSKTNCNAFRLFWTLDYLGHEKMAILNGGLNKWLHEKRLNTTDPTTLPKGNFKPKKINAQYFLDHQSMQKCIGKKDTIIIDTRSADEYFGVSFRKPDLSRGGHIPGAKLMKWSFYLKEEPKGVWTVRSPKEIEDMHQSMGITKDKEIAIYCNTGHLASANYWAMRLMGYPKVGLYTGSLSEWTYFPEKDYPLTKYNYE